MTFVQRIRVLHAGGYDGEVNRRISGPTSLFLLASVLVLLAVTLISGARPASEAHAADGDPGDYCSQSPDYPLGWNFNEACRGHDECIDDLRAAGDRSIPARLECDDVFLDDLLASPHAVAVGACSQHLVCRVVAQIYYYVVRFVTERFGGFASLLPVELPSAAQFSHL